MKHLLDFFVISNDFSNGFPWDTHIDTSTSKNCSLVGKHLFLSFNVAKMPQSMLDNIKGFRNEISLFHFPFFHFYHLKKLLYKTMYQWKSAAR